MADAATFAVVDLSKTFA